MISDVLRANLVAIATTYTKAKKGSLKSTSKDFYGNSQFFEDFKAKRVSISIDKYDQIVAKFQERWPPDVEWPALRAAIIRAPQKTG